MANYNLENSKDKLKVFTDARFGMFIHWGLYSIPARGEWVRSNERITADDYEKFFYEFNPVNYNPKEWAKLAKEAGMKYVVMTTKHHDGFCLFDSKYTDYKATNTLAKRDLIKEYVEAFREEGLAVGFYYSLLDWHHEDFPAYGDRHHPMRDNENFKENKGNFNRYIEYFHNQVEELLTNYGKIDIIWFDFSYDNMTGEKWGASKLIKRVRELQPHIIINNRLGGNLKKSIPDDYAGDFTTPEQIIPPEALVNEKGALIPWEACITLNDHWGYCSQDKNYKSSEEIIRALVECVSKNGNLILNVGPNAKGEIPEESINILKEVGHWLKQNGHSIYGCTKSILDKPEWGRYTQKDKYLYAHIFQRGVGPVNLRGLSGKIKRARLLCDGSEISIETPWNAEDFKKDAFLNFKSASLPDKKDTVILLELK
ncbi:alpha-L-fucosidase [Haloimpatiens lingqiaonensis]|uniref:alpha-L-fucosidase n=1 Tax=Haloimpatiens lingqiaonensis TaxID=1380675 RepID=UPI0010FCE3B6|nr:alpha-L-fucosidase [Haloimpatiens lingqiaonensis]